MQTKLFFTFFVSLFFIGCPKDEPCTTCPPPAKDTIITVEKELCNGLMPAVSPDGSKIAYTYKGDIWVIDTAGIQTNVWVDSSQYPWIWHTDTIAGKPTQLTFGPEIDVMPRWKPDGQTIGFIRSNQGEYNKGLLFTVPATGGATTQFVFNQFIADSLMDVSRVYGQSQIPIWDWSIDGKYVAYFSVNGLKTYLNVQSLIDGNIKLYREVYDFSNSSGGRSFAWSPEIDELVFISGKKIRFGALHKFNLISKEEIIDSTLSFPNNLSKGMNNNKFIYSGLDEKSEVVIVETNLTTLLNKYITRGNLGLKWSFDEKYILYELPGTVGGPLGYTYSQLFIFNIERNKDYMLTNNGDNNLHNFFFEFGRESNCIYFERFNKINKTTFQFP